MALPPGATLSVNLPVLAFTLGLALMTTLLFGFAPAWHGSRVGVSEALKSGGRSSGSRSRQRLAQGLIAAEIMFSLVLLAGAGMLIRSIANFASVPLGFNPDRPITMTAGLPPLSYPEHGQRAAFYGQLQSRLLALPEVEGVGMSSHVALKGSYGVSAVTVEGHTPADPRSVILDTEQQFITAGYLRFMGIPLERGREFSDPDQGPAPAVAMVNAALVRKYFPHEDPLGRRISFSGSKASNPWLTIVGICGDEKQSTPFQEMAWVDPPIVYRPLAQQPAETVDLVVRVRSAQTLSGAAIQRAVFQLAPDVRVSEVEAMERVLNRHTAYPRFRAILMGAFAGLALLLAVVGLYGVLSQLTLRRSQEIGIRMALGAQGKDVLQLIMKQGLLLAGVGVVSGLGIALWLAHFLRSLLYGVGPEDPVTLGSVALVLILAALLATYLPARRATRLNPMDALRSE